MLVHAELVGELLEQLEPRSMPACSRALAAPMSSWVPTITRRSARTLMSLPTPSSKARSSTTWINRAMTTVPVIQRR